MNRDFTRHVAATERKLKQVRSGTYRPDGRTYNLSDNAGLVARVDSGETVYEDNSLAARLFRMITDWMMGKDGKG